MSKFFGYTLIALGGMGICMFGAICFSPKPIEPVLPVPSAAPASKPDELPEKTESMSNLPVPNGKFECTKCKKRFMQYSKTCPACGESGT